MPKVKITGYIDFEESEVDFGAPDGPLTPKAYQEYFVDGMATLAAIEDVQLQAGYI